MPLMDKAQTTERMSVPSGLSTPIKSQEAGETTALVCLLGREEEGYRSRPLTQQSLKFYVSFPLAGEECL